MEGWMGNEAVRLFAVCYLILVLKMMAVGTYTGMTRIRRSVFSAPEDYAFTGSEPAAGRDEGIERARRAHRNDLENILPFFGVGLFYALSGPSATGAWISFGGFTLARVLHTLLYLGASQPGRTIAFTVGALLLLWMVLATGWSLLT